MLTASPLPRMVLRAVKALTESGSAPSLRSLTAVVPAPAAQVVSVVRALDAQGYLSLGDATRMRLTMRGLAAACASRVVTTDRRKAPRDRHWAGAMAAGNDSEESNDSRRPGLRKVAIVA